MWFLTSAKDPLKSITTLRTEPSKPFHGNRRLDHIFSLKGATFFCPPSPTRPFSFIPSSLLALRWMFGSFVRNQSEPVRRRPRPTCHVGRCSPPEVWRTHTNHTFMLHLFTPVVSVAGVLPFLEITTVRGWFAVGAD